MNVKVDRLISIATLGTSLIAIFLVMKKPAPVSQPLPPAVAAASAQSFQQKIDQLESPKQEGQAPAEVHLTSDEVSAAIAQAAGAVPAAATPATAGAAPVNLSSPDAVIAGGQPEVKDYQVN